MSAYIRIANLPLDIDESKIDEKLDADGLSDRTSFKLLRDDNQCVLWIGVPWERHIADAVARKLNGAMWHDRPLHISATTLFEE
jgi:hypothetical protein